MNILKMAAGVLGFARGLLASHGLAQTRVGIPFTAIFTEVIDATGVLQGAVYSGQTITGSYVIDATASDQSPLPKIGAYEFKTAPSASACRQAQSFSARIQTRFISGWKY